MATVVGLDVGTSKIACLVGETDEERRDGRLRIAGVGIVPSRGIKKGAIVNLDEAAGVIEAAVDKAERTSGREITNCYVGVAGAHIAALNSRGTVSISRSDHLVEAEDVTRALESARTIAIPHSQEVIHVVPRGYWLDNENGVRDPVGLHGYRLEVEAHIVTAAATALQTTEKCVNQAGVQVDGFVLEPLASGEAVLKEDETELGVVLADIGGGTTDISIFLEGSIWHTISLPVGGYHFSHDLAVGLQCPLAVAEDLKIRYGHASPDDVTDDSPIEVSSFGDSPLRGLTRHDIAEILSHRVLDIFDLILREMKRSGYDGLLPAGIVFCGGSAQLVGLRETARAYFGLPVRVAAPQNLAGLVDVLGTPAYATSVGLLHWGLRHDRAKLRRRTRGAVSQRARDSTAPMSASWLERLRALLGPLLPD
ncbi:MAG TPA: cell division protein FtsA [Chloroflexi bacterium]|nr:cell division protein FtsA [Chloroflexota bacterium]